MNLLFANPISLAFHYLTLFFYGTETLDSLHAQFSELDQKFAERNSPHSEKLSRGGDVQTFDFIIGISNFNYCISLQFIILIWDNLVFKKNENYEFWILISWWRICRGGFSQSFDGRWKVPRTFIRFVRDSRVSRICLEIYENSINESQRKSKAHLQEGWK